MRRIYVALLVLCLVTGMLAMGVAENATGEMDDMETWYAEMLDNAVLNRANNVRLKKVKNLLRLAAIFSFMGRNACERMRGGKAWRLWNGVKREGYLWSLS